MALYAGSGPFEALFGGVMRVVDTYIVGSVFDLDHVKIIVFTVLIGGMVRIITINGGMQGWSTGCRKGQRRLAQAN